MRAGSVATGWEAGLAEVVITEFMDEAAVADLARDFDVRYDPSLVDRRDELLGAVGSGPTPPVYPTVVDALSAP